MNFSAKTQGVWYIGLSATGYAWNDLFMKFLLQELSMPQTVFLRGIFVCGLLFCCLPVKRVDTLARHEKNDGVLLCLRVLCEIGATFMFLIALAHMSIFNISAIIQMMPILIIFIAGIVLKEKNPLRRYVSVLLGFVGALLIIRPGMSGENGIFSALALLSICCMVARDLLTARLSASRSSAWVTFVTAVVVFVVAGISSFFADWRSPLEFSWQTVVMIFASGLAISGGFFFGVKAMRVISAGFTAPFRYLGVVWSVLFSALIFKDRIDFLSATGMTLIVASGLYLLYAEKNTSRQRRTTSV